MCDDFSKIAQKVFKNSIKEPRLIIPFFDEDNKIIGVQGRSFRTKMPKIRYITYKCPAR
jgi:DNA primase